MMNSTKIWLRGNISWNTWASALLILRSWMGVWRSSLPNSYCRDPRWRYSALMGSTRVFSISRKVRICLLIHKHYINLHCDTLCWQKCSQHCYCILLFNLNHILSLHLGSAIQDVERWELDELCSSCLQDQNTCGCWLQDVVKSGSSLQGVSSLHWQDPQYHHRVYCTREYEVRGKLHLQPHTQRISLCKPSRCP